MNANFSAFSCTVSESNILSYKPTASAIIDRAESCTRNKEKLALLKQLDLDGRMLALSVWYGNWTECRHIEVPAPNGRSLFMSDPLTHGNSKIDNRCLCSDLVAVESCGNCENCKEECYAVKAQVQYFGTLAKRSINFWLAKNEPEIYFSEIDKQLTKEKREFCRPHTAGEFFDQRYLNNWTEICGKHSEKRFWAYTKMQDILDFSAMEKLNNFNLIYSFLPDGSLNFDEEKIILAKCKALGVPVCKYRKGMSAAAMPHCGGSCKICLYSKHVGFVKH